jgi:hypothetical protein
VLPLLLEPEFRQPVFRAVAARLAFVRWIVVVAVVAVVPAPALEPVSLHFRQSWQALLQKINSINMNITQAWLAVCSLFGTAMQFLFGTPMYKFEPEKVIASFD